MVWNIFNESKSKLRKAAKTIIDSEDGEEIEFIEVANAYKVLADYRSSYAYPVQSMIGYFRKKAFEVDKKATIVRRLKRQQSIISKLRRFPKMRVDRMQDIGGIRVIVEDIGKVSALKREILKGRTRNTLKKSIPKLFCGHRIIYKKTISGNTIIPQATNNFDERTFYSYWRECNAQSCNCIIPKRISNNGK